MSEISNIFQGKKQQEQAGKQQKMARQLEAAKKRKEEEEREREETIKKGKTRYGGRGTPSGEFLGESQIGSRKTLLGG